MRKSTEINRSYARLIDDDTVRGHWLWKGPMRAGEPVMRTGNHSLPAVRVIWRMEHGVEPKQLSRLASQCSYKMCVKPDHFVEHVGPKDELEPMPRNFWPVSISQVPLAVKWGLVKELSVKGVIYFKRGDQHYARMA